LIFWDDCKYQVEEQFSQELYMNTGQIKSMLDRGMHFGFHGSSHSPLNLLSENELQQEMSESLNFCKSIGTDLSQLTIAYPYGDFDKKTKKAAKAIGCKLGFTVKPDIADLGIYDELELPRLDTNDIPQNNSAEVDHWFHKG